jgi:hypothetical protein
MTLDDPVLVMCSTGIGNSLDEMLLHQQAKGRSIDNLKKDQHFGIFLQSF